jgi:hypothetical protein
MSHFDDIFKQRLQKSFIALLKSELGENFEYLEPKPIELRKQLKRKADFIFLEKHTNQDFILHLEIQTQNDVDMLKRMYLYSALLFEKYDLPVKQIVLFLGTDKETKSTMVSEKDFGYFTYCYKLLNISNIPYKKFLKNKDTLVFTILGKFERNQLLKVLGEIIKKAQTNFSKEELGELLLDLEIFGKLRNLEQEIQTLTPQLMPFDIDWSDIPSIKKAELKGELKAKLEDAKAMLLDNLPVAQIAKYTKLSLEQIVELQEDIKKEDIKNKK